MRFGTLLTYQGEAVYIGTRGQQCVSRNAAARLNGVSPQAVLERIRRRTLPAEYRGHMGTAVWLIPILALEVTTVDQTARRYGRIRRGWHGSQVLTCRGCRRRRKLGMSLLCLECEGTL